MSFSASANNETACILPKPFWSLLISALKTPTPAIFETPCKTHQPLVGLAQGSPAGLLLLFASVTPFHFLAGDANKAHAPTSFLHPLFSPTPPASQRRRGVPSFFPPCKLLVVALLSPLGRHHAHWTPAPQKSLVWISILRRLHDLWSWTPAFWLAVIFDQRGPEFLFTPTPEVEKINSAKDCRRCA